MTDQTTPSAHQADIDDIDILVGLHGTKPERDTWTRLRTALLTTPQPLAIGLDREVVADAVHRGRFLSDREPTPFETEDRSGREYCFRIADKVLVLAAPAEGWQGIETAPKDGTQILIYRDGWQEAPRARWGDHDGEDDDHNPTIFGGWFLASEWHTYGVEDGFLGWNEDVQDGCMPTHWMPLPAAPIGGRS